MATILVANADRKFTEVLRGVLAAYRHEVLTARTGEDALRLFETSPPAVVLLDLGILGMSGLEVLAKMRARAPHIPVVILSGEVPIEVEDRVRELGVTDVLRKRLKMDIIMQAVSHALQHAEPPATAVPPVLTPVRPATILIVDDDREICDLLSEFLERRGYRVKTAVTGEAALGMIQHEPPDLILLDIYMPGMNGVEVLHRLMAPSFPIQPPPGVIMLTASQDVPLLKESLDLGAFDVLSKPVDLKQVELAVMVKLAMTGAE